jgi:predicted flap endonuclease-1-like 5' DNA nuclease
LWIETALLFFASYLLGCCIGCLFRQAFGGSDAEPSGIARWNRNLGDPGPGFPIPERIAGVRNWERDLSQQLTVGPPGVALYQHAGAAGLAGAAAAAAVAAPAPPPPAPPSAAPAPVAPAAPLAAPPAPAAPPVAAASPIAGEDLIAGRRPAGLAAPRGGVADDLKLIRGIGKQNEGRLHGLGIWHFDQIAAWTPDNALWVGSYLAFPGRIEREEWVPQAQQLAAGVETAFAGRVKRGEVATSKDDGSMGQANVADIATDLFQGVRPAGLISAPRGDKGDDLTLINGVGRALEQKLHALGVWHFDQIAAMSDDELRYVSQAVGFPGRALREDWRAEADTLAKGGDTAHSLAVKAGKIPNSPDDPEAGKT